MTDMARLREGRVGGQFWSVWIEGTYKGDEAIRMTIEQIDIVTRLIKAYPNDLALASTADDIERIHKSGRDCVAHRGRRRTPDRRIAGRASAILPARRALHDLDPQPDHGVGGQRHRRAEV